MSVCDGHVYRKLNGERRPGCGQHAWGDASAGKEFFAVDVVGLRLN